jgi:hypothetical protein
MLMKHASTTISDWQLLAEYASNNSHEAFAMIVARYADMVHATALRRSRNPALAEGATQAVFIVLARSASNGPCSDCAAGSRGIARPWTAPPSERSWVG